MRPVANFTLHAILAAALAALATSAAAAKEPAQFSLVAASFKNAGGASATDDHRQHIEVLSYSFGNSQAGRVSKVEALPIKQKAIEPSAGHGGSRGSGKVVVHDISTNSATGPANFPGNTKVKPIKLRPGTNSTAAKEPQAGAKEIIAEREKDATVDDVPADGSGVLHLRGSLPGCRAGAAFPAAVLQTASVRYDLSDVTIEGCGADGISVAYRKVTVRGWDPEKKEQ